MWLTQFNFQVDASDLDKDANGRINYKIAGGNSVDFFEIDEQSGQISLLKEIPLAENTLPMIILYVTATDGKLIFIFSNEDTHFKTLMLSLLRRIKKHGYTILSERHKPCLNVKVMPATNYFLLILNY